MILDDKPQGLEAAAASVAQALEAITPELERVVCLGVTGLSRAGKTVFITSLVANLKKPGAMVELVAARDGRIKAATLQPPPESTVPCFSFEDYLRTMTSADKPSWPLRTTSLSKLRLSLRMRRTAKDWLGRDWLGRLEETIHLDIIDFPGEWLIDLTMMDKNFVSWSSECLKRITSEALNGREEAITYLKQLKRIDTKIKSSDEDIKDLAKMFTTYLKALKKDGYSSCTPGRFLQPGDLENATVLTFAPLYVIDKPSQESLYKTFESRFKKYKKTLVQPFFDNYLSKIDRQVVLVDVMAAIEAGPGPFEDHRKAMKDILSVFRPGQNPWLAQLFPQLFQGYKVEKILFAATKTDHLNHSQHNKLSTYPDGVLRESVQRADLEGAKTKVMSIAALRVTDEYVYVKDNVEYHGVRGLLDSKNHWFAYPGELPPINELLEEAKNGEKQWQEGDMSFPKFLPKPRNRDEPLPHIRLDQALEFLIGDLL